VFTEYARRECGGQELSEQQRSSKSRQYQMRKRAAQVDGTRQRIVEAASNLHGTIGPAETTIAGIAREAGVTRLTVHRHFPDEETIFEACSAHWLAGQRPPDPAAWEQVSDPVQRFRTGLTDLYRFYREGEAMLTRVYRDKAVLPASRRQALDDRDAALMRVLLDAFPDNPDHRLAAVVGHATSFWTWRSLCVDHGLPDPDAVEIMTTLVTRTPDS
jgi:AcrR family transcriptional regulator